MSTVRRRHEKVEELRKCLDLDPEHRDPALGASSARAIAATLFIFLLLCLVVYGVISSGNLIETESERRAREYEESFGGDL